MRIAIAHDGVRVILESPKIVVELSRICVFVGDDKYAISNMKKDDVELAFDNLLQNGYVDLTHFTAVKE